MGVEAWKSSIKLSIHIFYTSELQTSFTSRTPSLSARIYGFDLLWFLKWLCDWLQKISTYLFSILKLNLPLRALETMAWPCSQRRTILNPFYCMSFLYFNLQHAKQSPIYIHSGSIIDIKLKEVQDLDTDLVRWLASSYLVWKQNGTWWSFTREKICQLRSNTSYLSTPLTTHLPSSPS